MVPIQKTVGFRVNHRDDAISKNGTALTASTRMNEQRHGARSHAAPDGADDVEFIAPLSAGLSVTEKQTHSGARVICRFNRAANVHTRARRKVEPAIVLLITG